MTRSIFLSLFALCGLAAAELPAGYPSIPARGIESAIQYPLVGLGTWLYNNSVAEGAVGTALAAGYRHVDTALGYGNQRGVGAAIAASGLKRSELFITTKVPPANGSATVANLATCLSELGVEYVDTMLIHFPASDAKTRKEQWMALEAFAKAGKARSIGVSHYCRTHVAEILTYATLPVALNQNQYHVGMGWGDTQPRLHDKAYDEAHGIVYMAYSTLCGPCDPPHNKELISGELVTSIGRAHNKSGAQVALKWAVQQGIPVIPKASNVAYQRENLDLFDFELSDVEMARLSAAQTPAETGTKQAPDDAQDCSAEQQ